MSKNYLRNRNCKSDNLKRNLQNKRAYQMLFHDDPGAFCLAPELRNDPEEAILEKVTTTQEPQY